MAKVRRKERKKKKKGLPTKKKRKPSRNKGKDTGPRPRDPKNKKKIKGESKGKRTGETMNGNPKTTRNERYTQLCQPLEEGEKNTIQKRANNHQEQTKQIQKKKVNISKKKAGHPIPGQLEEGRTRPAKHRGISKKAARRLQINSIVERDQRKKTTNGQRRGGKG